MGKLVSDYVLDDALNHIKNYGTRWVICSSCATDYTTMSALKLGEVGASASDYTVADGTTGRKVTMVASSGNTVATTGEYNHLCIGTATGSAVLLYQTTGTAENLTATNKFDIPSWSITIADPT